MKSTVHIVCFILFGAFCTFGQTYITRDIADTSIIKNITGTQIIKNITDTTAWWWNNRSESTFSISDSIYTIQIKNPGNERWNVQIVQGNITIDSGSTYLYSFVASSDRTRRLATSVCEDHDNLNPHSSRDTISLTTSPKLFIFPFTMKSATDTRARVEFNCGLDSGNISLSQVSLIKLERPFLQFTNPKADKLFHENDSINITWLSLGNESPLTLEYSNDYGILWNSIASGIPDTGSYKWVPLIGFFPWCQLRIYADDNSGAPYDTSNLFEIAPQTELINSTFTKDIMKWEFLASPNVTFTATNGTCKIEITASGTNPEDIQFTRDNLHFYKDGTYKLSFTAYSSKNDSMFVDITKSQNSSISFLPDSSMKILLTPTKTAYSMTFTVTATDTGKVEFNLGLSNSTIYLDNVSLVRNHISQLKSIHSISAANSKGVKRVPSKLVYFGKSTNSRTINNLAVKQPLFDLMGRSVRNRSTVSRNNLNASSGMYIPEPYRGKR